MFFSKLTSQRHAMKSAIAAAAPLLAFQVRDHQTQETAEPIAPRQKYERRFTLTPSDLSDPKAAVHPPVIDRVVVSAPGVTFISFDPDAVVPSVKVSAELPEVLELFDVVERGGSGIEIRVKGSLEKRQYVLTEVSLPVANALRSLEVRGSGIVVVEDNTIPASDPQADVNISLDGSGDVFVTNHSDVVVGSLTMDLAGSGDMQLVVPSLTLRDAFETKIAASGDARVFAGSITAPRIVVNTAGSGDMQIAALSLEALSELSAIVSGSGSIKTIGETIKTNAIYSSIAGSGNVKLVTTTELVANTLQASVSGSGAVQIASADARCVEGKISVSGSGTVDARDLVVHQASANVSGSGSILVRAGTAIEAVTSGSGSITVVGDLPPRVSGNPRTRTSEQKPSQLDALTAKRSSSIPSPTRVDAFEKLTRFNGTINVQSFSDFIDAVKLLWNHQKGDHVEINIKSGSAATP